MVLAAVDLLYYPEQMVPLFTSSFSSVPMTAAGDKAGVIFEAPKAGTIDRVGFRSVAVSTGATVDVRLETVSGTDGNPTGTLLGAGSNAAVAVSAANTWHEATLTTPVVVSAGQLIALVVVNPAGSPGNLNLALFTTNPAIGLPYAVGFSSGLWAKFVSHGVLAVRYTDGTYPRIPGTLPVSTVATAVSLSTSTTPDEVGNRITLPVPCRAAGFYWYWATSTAPPADVSFKFYDVADTLLATRTVDKDQFRATAAGTQLFLRLPAPLDLPAGTYRLTVNPGTTTAGNYTIISTVPTAAVMGAMPQGTNVYRTHRTDAGAWTDVTTERAWLGLWLSAVDDGVQTAQPRAYGYIG